MIEFPRDPQNVIPTSSVKIVGLGGAGTNMLDRVALDGLDGAELLALNTDIRTLSASVAKERVQLGRNLTKGLGTGGDPELGNQAVLEAEDEVRAAFKGRKIVFVCVGLGGGTGSGAAPIVARIAREEGAFVVMFATMPFGFEGRRRREQAETALNELAVLSNALVTFDNSRMGELVLAKQGIHEAFAAADRMISESIKAVIRLVVRPGLINVGLDDLMSALRTTRSRCLFGSGIARGKDRAQKALRNALGSPLLDQGALLKDAQTVLVHLCGGEDLTLFEIELLMESLGKHVPEKAQVLFGAAVDPSMTDQLSITLVSSLPEERLRRTMPDEEYRRSSPALEPSMGFAAATAPMAAVKNPFDEPAEPQQMAEDIKDPEPEPWAAEEEKEQVVEEEKPSAPEPDEAPPTAAGEAKPLSPFEPDLTAVAPEPEDEIEDLPNFEDEVPAVPSWISAKGKRPFVPKNSEPEMEVPFAEPSPPSPDETPGEKPEAVESEAATEPKSDPPVLSEEEPSRPAKSGGQGELTFDSGPKGRFEGADPSLIDGEDLDVPAFLRRKR